MGIGGWGDVGITVMAMGAGAIGRANWTEMEDLTEDHCYGTDANASGGTDLESSD
jgi:hypothetical protein